MEFLTIENEYQWVLRVLESSINIDQINTSKNLFTCFMNKWSYDISDISEMKFKNTFKLRLTHQENKIKKNKILNINYN